MSDKVKVAFCGVIYKNYEQSVLLIDSLKSHGDVFLHVNAYSNDLYDALKNKYREEKSVNIIDDRVKVHWGGFSNMRAIFNLFEKAKEIEPDYYQYFTGMDFPIKPINDYLKYLKKYEGNTFISIHKVEPQQEIRQVFSYHYWVENPQFRDDVKMRMKDNDTALKEYEEGRRKAMPFGWVLMRSRPTYCLHSETADLVIKYSKCDEYNQLFESSMASDEYYVPSIVWNTNVKTKPTLTWMSMNKQDVRKMTGQPGSDFVTEEDYLRLKRGPESFLRTKI